MSSSNNTTKQPPFPLYLLPSLPFRRRNTLAKSKPQTSVADIPTNPFVGSPGWQTSTPSELASSSLPTPIASRSLASTGSSSNNITPSRGIPGTSLSLQPGTPTYPDHSPELNPNDLPLTPTSTLPTPSTSSSFSTISPFSTTSTALTTPSTSPPCTSSLAPKSRSFPLNDSASTLYTSPSSLASPPRSKLQAQQPTLRCLACSTDIAYASQIISKGFTGRHGRAYLLSPLPPSPSVPSASNCATTNSPQVSQTSRFNLLDPFGSFSSNQSYRWEDEHDDDTESKKEKYDLLNVTTHPPARRQLVTGLHVVADISCRVCERVVGWKYVDAAEASQRYKIGKFIVETKRVVRCEGWEDEFSGSEFEAVMEVPGANFASLFRKKMAGGERASEVGMDERPFARAVREKGKGKGSSEMEQEVQKKEKGEDISEEIEFDSEDEEECEEIFAGTWDRDVVRRRRAKRADLERKKKVV